MEAEEGKEIRMPTSSANRPVRQRKSVVRLVASIDSEPPVKEFVIEKGNGTALKDIPNVAYKLSKRKADNTLRVLHTILFGRRAKASRFKSNISQFSGFVWSENEEKQKNRVKEKLDKLVKEQLLEFCDLLDIPTPNKVNTRKEDIVAKLIDFLVAPYATSSELLAEKDQGKKRKQMATPGASTSASTTLTKRPYKSRKRNEDISKERVVNDTLETEDNLVDVFVTVEDEVHGIEETKNSIPKCNVSQSASEKDKDVSGDTSRGKKGSKNLSAKKNIDAKGKEKEVSKPKKSSPVAKAISSKSASTSPPEEEALRPSDEALKTAVCEILKEADFMTITFTDIMKILAEQFKMDLTSRKPSIKIMVHAELTRLANTNAFDGGDGGGNDAHVEKNEMNRASQGVKA